MLHTTGETFQDLQPIYLNPCLFWWFFFLMLPGFSLQYVRRYSPDYASGTELQNGTWFRALLGGEGALS